ncbi:MAG: hypothetical protein KGH69_03635 [Candidatus Micrarchaeota archaeon]|nr:hypothetical protein [Candidatus Micrarchaeota archaeon]
MATREAAMDAIAGKERLLDGLCSVARVGTSVCSRIGNASKGMAYSSLALLASTPTFYIYMGKSEARLAMASVGFEAIGAVGLLNSVHHSAMAAKDIWLLKRGIKGMQKLELDADALGGSLKASAEATRSETAGRIVELRGLGRSLYYSVATCFAGGAMMGSSVYFAELINRDNAYSRADVSGAFYFFIMGITALVGSHVWGITVSARAKALEEDFRSIVRGRDGIRQ